MFDQHHLHLESREVRVNATITEHRAPTDASVALLRELEKAAEAKVLGSIRLQGTPVDCVLLHRYSEFSDDHEFIVRYKLGSKAMDMRHTVHGASIDTQRDSEKKETIATELATALGNHIARALLDEPMRRAIVSGETFYLGSKP